MHIKRRAVGREHGEAAIENFTEPKSVWINTGG
jgi:acyl-CoA reductase-like NAD-dependent aldehyde dehydrogenase